MNKMIKAFLMFIVAGVVFVDLAPAQEVPRKARFGFSLTAGFNPPDDDVEFGSDFPDGKDKTSFVYGVGVGVGGVKFISSSKLSFFAEVFVEGYDIDKVVRADGATAVRLGRILGMTSHSIIGRLRGDTVAVFGTDYLGTWI